MGLYQNTLAANGDIKLQRRGEYNMSREIEYIETPDGEIYVQSRRVNYLSEWARKLILEKHFKNIGAVFITSNDRWQELAQSLPVKKKII